jgi:hypothetical protein
LQGIFWSTTELLGPRLNWLRGASNWLRERPWTSGACVKRDALKAAWKREDAPNVSLGVGKNDYSFLALCKVISFHGFLNITILVLNPKSPRK